MLIKQTKIYSIVALSLVSMVYTKICQRWVTRISHGVKLFVLINILNTYIAFWSFFRIICQIITAFCVVRQSGSDCVTYDNLRDECSPYRTCMPDGASIKTTEQVVDVNRNNYNCEMNKLL